MSENVGQDSSQILPNFRQFTKSHIDQFISEKNRVFKLLGSSQQYSSGIFRESLLRTFLRNLLPKSISISSGFIYGFEVEKNSKQIDIIIWDSSKYGAIFSLEEFVIVPPESVIAIITVKSNMEKEDILSGLDNLSSIIDLDLRFRRSRLKKEDSSHIFLPIYKYFVSYKGPQNTVETPKTITDYYKEMIYSNKNYTNNILEKLKTINPMDPSIDIIETISTYIPNLIFSLEETTASYFPGWGPPTDSYGQFEYGPEKIKRLPYLYKQNHEVTTQLDKFVADIIGVVNKYLGTPGWSTSAAWSDIHPVYGFRMGDSSEIDEQTGLPLIDYEKSSISYQEKKPLVPEGWV